MFFFFHHRLRDIPPTEREQTRPKPPPPTHPNLGRLRVASPSERHNLPLPTAHQPNPGDKPKGMSTHYFRRVRYMVVGEQHNSSKTRWRRRDPLPPPPPHPPTKVSWLAGFKARPRVRPSSRGSCRKKRRDTIPSLFAAYTSSSTMLRFSLT